MRKYSSALRVQLQRGSHGSWPHSGRHSKGKPVGISSASSLDTGAPSVSLCVWSAMLWAVTTDLGSQADNTFALDDAGAAQESETAV